MSTILDLNKKNYYDFLLQSYTNVHCVNKQEFEEDILHIKYVKKLFKRYEKVKNTEKSNIRLILNHIVIIFNVFKMDAGPRILFFRLEPKLYSILKTFLLHLSFMPTIIHGVEGKNIYSKKIPINKALQKLLIEHTK